MTELPERQEFQVSQEHIEQGKPQDAGSCPIALAMTGRVQGYAQVFPSTTLISNEDGYTNRIIRHSREVTQWINQFDRIGEMIAWRPEPITLQINEQGMLVIKPEEEQN